MLFFDEFTKFAKNRELMCSGKGRFRIVIGQHFGACCLEIHRMFDHEKSLLNEDSLDFAITNRFNSARAFAAGYISDGDPLLSSESHVPELPVVDISNGYMSEGGITVYAQKMKARFREGLEAVRDGMRNRQVNFNDRKASL
uniref:Uncharacterized protein n=1 Tax=Syphacia muris TaxID=451379 RepID=A0A0N5A9W0_9BILA